MKHDKLIIKKTFKSSNKNVTLYKKKFNGIILKGNIYKKQFLNLRKTENNKNIFLSIKYGV